MFGLLVITQVKNCFGLRNIGFCIMVKGSKRLFLKPYLFQLYLLLNHSNSSLKQEFSIIVLSIN